MRSLVPGVRPPPSGTRDTWLVIETPNAFRYLDTLPARPSVVMARYRDLDDRLLARVQADWVLCPLMTPSFDALDVLRQIRQSPLRPQVGILSPPLPNSAMVERELRANARDLTIRLLQV